MGRCQASEPEVGRLEQRRESILEGVRKGYEHAHVLLRRTVPHHATAHLNGREAALQVGIGGLFYDLRGRFGAAYACIQVCLC